MQRVFTPPYLPWKLLRLSLYSLCNEISWLCLDFWHVLCCTFGRAFQFRNSFCLENFLSFFFLDNFFNNFVFVLSGNTTNWYKIAWVDFLGGVEFLNCFLSSLVSLISLFLVFFPERVLQFCVLTLLLIKFFCYHVFNFQELILIWFYFVIAFCFCFKNI